MKHIKRNVLTGVLAVLLLLAGVLPTAEQPSIAYAEEVSPLDMQSIPAYADQPYVAVNENVPVFSMSEANAGAFEEYSDLDSLGRCGDAFANIGQETMPSAERSSIGQIKPSGWQTVKYDCVDGNYLYNRCHLIGYQLSGENANEKNLITGTRYMNVEGMLPFENMVADYIQETGNHVLYRATPVFEGDNLVASGVQLEAMSVEDSGEGIFFNVFCYNVQPGVTIDYATGDSYEGEDAAGAAEVYTATSDLNVRASESTDADIVGQIAYGDTIEVQSVSGDWAKVLYDGSTAYVAADYLTEGEAALETEPPVQPQVQQEALVWIPRTGSKYHSNSGCSNMKNPSQVTKDNAVSMGYEPCKKCY